MTPTSPLPLADSASLRRWTRALVRSRLRPLALVLGALVVVTAAFAAIPAIVGSIVDTAIDGGQQSDIIPPVVAMVVVTVMASAGVVVGRYQAARFGESILDELRTSVYESATSLPASVVEEVGTGELVARATGDVETLANATRDSIPLVLFSTVAGSGLIIALAITDYRLALAAIAAATIVAAPGVIWYLRNAGPRYHRERQADAGRAAALLEHYTGRATLAALGADAVTAEALEGQATERRAAQLSTTAARNRLRPSLRFGQAAALGAVLGTGTYLLDGGSLSAGALTAAALYVLNLIDPLNNLLEQLDVLQQSKAAMERIVGLIEYRDDESAATASHPTPAMPAEVAPALTLRQVTFGYEPDLPVLSGIDLSIPVGQRVMIVGPSGAGKSTLAGLMSGTHQPWRGSILIDGLPAGQLPAPELRRRIALVTQETHVFARTVRDNVTIGRPGATDDQVAAALSAAGAAPWIEDLDGGIDAEVSNTHPALSPARAQQLNVARILCLDPAIVVLDEAMAALDPDGAGQAERRLRIALEGRTVISIAHRLDAAPSMDRILVVDDGRITADGDHATLLAGDADYAGLWTTWSSART
ncbi:MAG: ABC transporter ATP-binding protein [Actinomycetota bacterium]